MALGLTPYQIIEKGTHPQLVIADDWERVELKYIATVQNGFAFSSKLFNNNEGLPLIRIRDIFSSETQNLYSGEYKDEFLVSKGDILIGMDGDFKVSKWPGKKGLLNQRVCRILFNSNNYEKDFLFLCIQPYLNAIHSETSAVTVKHLSSRTVNNIPFPLPPLVEQKAIVKKIEGLFSSLDSGIADLKKAQDQLVIYRQAVLKKAFEGEEIINSKKIELKNITSKIGSGSTPKGGRANYKTSGIPLVRSLNIHFDYIKYDGLAFIDKYQAEKLKNVIVQEGDVLLNITGASIGRVNIAPKEFNNGRVNQHVSIVRPKDNIFNTKFLKFYLQSSKIQNWIANVNVGATRQGLTKSALENLKIPIPSLEEQHQIVREIESRLSVCDNVEKSIKESLQKAQALRQSILKKAFEGTLLTKDEITACKAHPEYEPASVLLERIMEEKLKKK
ncbi:restriction endonuclease subunit S [Pontimicrobium sp. MEBiC01747]